MFGKRSKGRDGATHQGIVVRNPTTGLHELQVIITADATKDAALAISAAFEDVVAGHQGNVHFSGDIVFVVYGHAAAADLEPELVQAKQDLESRIAARRLKTMQGRPFRVRVEQRQGL